MLTTKKIIGGLTLHEGRVNHNLNQYALFAATERLLMHLVKLGGDRQVLHEVIREHSLVAWSAIQRGEANPLATLLSNDKTILELLERDEIIALLTAQEYSGDAPLRAKLILKEIRLLEDK